MDLHYNAFISYRHAPLDSKVAQDIQKRLERLHIPAEIRKKTGMKKIERIFRDHEELTITSNLGDDISRALENADFLIVVCSHSTKESQWVTREISYFLQTHDRTRVLTAIAAGEPCEVIPEVLLRSGDTEFEPLSCDYRGGFRKAHKTEIPRLAAPIIGCSYDELVMRHRQYRMRIATAALSAVTALTAAASGYMLWSRAQILQNYRNKQIQQSRYLAAESKKLTAEEDRVRAALLALEALPKDGEDRPLVPAALSALIDAANIYSINHQALFTSTEKAGDTDAVWSFYTNGNISDYAVTDDQQKLFAWDIDSNVYVWDIESRKLLWQKPFERKVYNVWAASNSILVVEDYSSWTAMNIETGEMLWGLQSDMDVVYDAGAPAEDGKAVVLWRDRNEEKTYLSVLDIETGEILVSDNLDIKMRDRSNKIKTSESGENVAIFYPEKEGKKECLAVYSRPQRKLYTFESNTGITVEKIDFVFLSEDRILLVEHPENYDSMNLGSAFGISLIKNRLCWISLWDIGKHGSLWTKELPYLSESVLTDQVKLKSIGTSDDPLVAVTAEKSVVILRQADGEAIKELTLPESAVNCISEKSGTKVFWLLSDGTGFLWNMDSPDYMRLDLFSSKTEDVRTLKRDFSTSFLTEVKYDEIRLYEPKANMLDPGFSALAKLPGGTSLSSCVFGHKIVLTYSGGNSLSGKSFVVYDMESGKQTAVFSPLTNIMKNQLIGSMEDPASGNRVFFCTDGNEEGHVVIDMVGMDDSECTLIPAEELLLLEQAVLREGKLVLIGKDAKNTTTVIRVDPFSMEKEIIPMKKIGNREYKATNSYISPDGERALFLTEDKECWLTDLSDGTVRQVPGLYAYKDGYAAFSDDHGMFAVLEDGGRTVVVYRDNLTEFCRIPMGRETVYLLHIDADHLFIGTEKNILRVYDLKKGELTAAMQYSSTVAIQSSLEPELNRWDFQDGFLFLSYATGAADVFDTEQWEYLFSVRGIRAYDPDKKAVVCIREDTGEVGYMHICSSEELIQRGKEFVQDTQLDSETRKSYGLSVTETE